MCNLMKNILIITAMNNEASEVIKDLKLVKSFPFLTYEGVIINKNITLIISKVGKTNASAATTYGLINYPDTHLLINFGITGGYKVNLNEVYLVNESLYDDVDATYFNYEFGQVPGFPNKYQSFINDKLKDLKYPLINLYTKDTFTINNTHDFPYLVDMEGAAIYQVSYIFKKPVLSFKLVSDLIGDKNQKDHYEQTTINMPSVLKFNLLKILEV